MPAGLLGHASVLKLAFRQNEPGRQSPFATDLFLLFGSTDSKQTLNGLFYLIADEGLPNISQIHSTAYQSSFFSCLCKDWEMALF